MKTFHLTHQVLRNFFFRVLQLNVKWYLCKERIKRENFFFITLSDFIGVDAIDLLAVLGIRIRSDPDLFAGSGNF
jgi:hypothetical protein